MDLVSRTVLHRKLSNSTEMKFGLEALKIAFIGDENQRSFTPTKVYQSTSGHCVSELQALTIKII